MTYTEFAEKHNLKLRYEKGLPPFWVDKNDGGTSYNVTLSQGKKQMTLKYWMGSAYKRGPKIGEVLESLAADYYVLNYDKEEYNREYWGGIEEWDDPNEYERMSRTYELITRQSLKLEKLLGDAITELLECEYDD